MKTTYLKGIMTLGVSAMLLFSSCLKDSRYFNAETVPNLAELPLSGLQHFTSDAVTAPGIDTVIFAVGVTSANPPTSSTTINLAVDNSYIDSYAKIDTNIKYLPIPTAAYKLVNSSVTIPAGKNSALTSVIIDKTQLDPAKSYMLPVKIVSAGGLPISANYSVHYYHVIGNPFAGLYNWTYKRWNNADGSGSPGTLTTQPTTISPVSPNQFEVASGYQGQRYEVTFTQVDATHFKNFQITFNSDDVKNILTASGITVTSGPVFGFGTKYDPTVSYTYAEAIQFFTFQYTVTNGSGAPRYFVEQFVHQ